MLAKYLSLFAPERELHVFDSFQGLPEKTVSDGFAITPQWLESLKVTCEQFKKTFNKAGIALPLIHQGWFNELVDNEIPNPICFAFLDSDFYESIKTSLAIVMQRLAHGGVIVVHDYLNTTLPGVKKACEEFAVFQIKNYDSMAIMTKKKVKFL